MDEIKYKCRDKIRDLHDLDKSIKALSIILQEKKKAADKIRSELNYYSDLIVE